MIFIGILLVIFGAIGLGSHDWASGGVMLGIGLVVFIFSFDWKSKRIKK